MGAIQLPKKKSGLEKNKWDNSGLLLFMKNWCFTNAQVMLVKQDNKRRRELVLTETLIFCKHISKRYLSGTHTMLMQFSTKKRTVLQTKDLSWQLSPQKRPVIREVCIIAITQSYKTEKQREN